MSYVITADRVADKILTLWASSLPEFIADMAPHRALILPEEGEWAGEPTFEAAHTIAQQGWAQGRTLLDPYRASLDNAIQHATKQTVETYQAAVTGSMVDVGSYLSGIPEYMIDTVASDVPRAGTQRSQLVHIGVSIGYAQYIMEPAIHARGAIVVCLAEILEAAGYRVAITAVRTTSTPTTTRPRKKLTRREVVPIKHHKDPVQRDQLLFALAHPAFLRRYCFVAHTLMKNLDRQGVTQNMSPAIVKHLGIDLHVPCMVNTDTTNWNNPSTLDQLLTTHLAAYGITLTTQLKRG